MRGWHKVRIDGAAPIRAYVDPDDSWNGWSCPWFEFKEAMRMSEWLEPMCGESLDYDPEDDSFVCSDDTHEAFRGECVDDMHLYPIGRGSWMWMLEG